MTQRVALIRVVSSKNPPLEIASPEYFALVFLGIPEMAPVF